MQKHWIQRFLIKLGLFMLPLFVLLLADVWILPPEFFTFRAWEALRVHTFYPSLTGPFYPNQKLEIEEEENSRPIRISPSKEGLPGIRISMATGTGLLPECRT